MTKLLHRYHTAPQASAPQCKPPAEQKQGSLWHLVAGAGPAELRGVRLVSRRLQQCLTPAAVTSTKLVTALVTSMARWTSLPVLTAAKGATASRRRAPLTPCLRLVFISCIKGGHVNQRLSVEESKCTTFRQHKYQCCIKVVSHCASLCKGRCMAAHMQLAGVRHLNRALMGSTALVQADRRPCDHQMRLTLGAPRLAPGARKPHQTSPGSCRLL